MISGGLGPPSVSNAARVLGLSDTAQQTQGYTIHSTYAVSMLASVAVLGPTLKQYWVNASCLLEGLHHISTDL